MEEKKTILVVDDNASFLELFSLLPDAEQYQVITEKRAESALEVLEDRNVDLIISDVQMPEMDGVELFEKVQDAFPEIPVILMTAYGSTENAIDAVKRGAFHYFEKPLEERLELFWVTVREALKKGEMLRRMAGFERERALLSGIKTPLVGVSLAIRRVFQQIAEIADLGVTVLIQGETGTGKEVVARAIHEQGGRQDAPYFAVSCTEFAAGVLESELFGHEKGSFTGAVAQKKGLFEVVDKGTLFLDEISESPPALQAKLLRVLETRTVKRIGGVKIIPSDFRLLAATNRDLSAEVRSGRFRQDLFYRLNVYSIEIPPLRDRREDIPPIAEYYLDRFNKAYNRSIKGISENAMSTFRHYNWPGNVRELVNVMERAVITCTDPLITTRCLPFGGSFSLPVSDLNLSELEKFYIQRALQRTENNKTRAAELLGITRQTLMKKLKLYEEMVENGV